jgi:hypothetical protein
MTNRIFLGALSVALVAGASAASAQTVIIRDPALAPAPAAVVTQPVAAAPVETVETVRTVSTDVPARAVHRRASRSRAARVTTTRTVTRERIIQGPAVAVAPAVAAQPGYTTVDEPLYDVAPDAAVAPAPYYGATGVTVAPTYQYIYEPDRILVVDPATGIAVQSIPR